MLSYSNDKVSELPIESITPNANQPRQHFNEDSIAELAVSIKEFGIVQPLVVTNIEQNKYSIIAGERRWRAAQVAGLKKVPVIIRSATELETLEIALIENVQREDLSPLDQAVSIERLHEQFSMSYEQIAKRLGKGYSTVANIVRLLQLPANMQDALRDKVISEGHARALLSLQKDPSAQATLFEIIMNRHLSVRQAEQYVVGLRTSENTSKGPELNDRTKSDTKETKQLSKHLGVPVSVSYLAKGGKLNIRFKDDAEYKDLVNKLLK
jgi:ParB family chromosome partitioning protein